MILDRKDIELLTSIYMGPWLTIVDPINIVRAERLFLGGYLTSRLRNGRYSLTVDGLMVLDSSFRAIVPRYFWSRHDENRIRIWKEGDSFDVFMVLNVKDFESYVKDIQSDGGIVFAGMPYDVDGDAENET